MEQFQTDLLSSVEVLVESVRQMEAAEATRFASDGKVSVTVRLPAELVEVFRASGDGWQTRMDAALADWLRMHGPTRTLM
ncbi:BrnA antitoxin family protein [Azotobacter beijerinckii]|uniref:BrnA antitoxin family protein n=1 Tax=Azotobacter beijerinckii TaxID=170623 RepID=UPI0029557B04|nr:BrnA antitoxin family protein [Azotobacter beijerinckii]MDV7210761.1 BrnA antitoxin family protein [Azotobacter beijerinckii]